MKLSLRKLQFVLFVFINKINKSHSQFTYVILIHKDTTPVLKLFQMLTLFICSLLFLLWAAVEIVLHDFDETGSPAVLRQSEKADPAVRPVHLPAAAAPLMRREGEQPVSRPTFSFPGPALHTSHRCLPQVFVFIGIGFQLSLFWLTKQPVWPLASPAGCPLTWPVVSS